jgi:4-aminobutyrate aminotransferase/(S)-3-amino-2-methylpropionate transaminase
MKAEDLPRRARAVEALFVPRLRELAAKYSQIGDVRGRGAMLAIELVSDPVAKTPDPALTTAVNKACHAEGLVTLTAGTYGNVLRFLPPLSSPDHLLAEGLDILEGAFAATV